MGRQLDGRLKFLATGAVTRDMANDKHEQEREHGSGQYTFEGGYERLCVCGHPLGVHTAARAKVDGVSQQPCMHEDLGGADAEPCSCSLFKPTRKAKAGKS